MRFVLVSVVAASAVLGSKVGSTVDLSDPDHEAMTVVNDVLVYSDDDSKPGHSNVKAAKPLTPILKKSRKVEAGGVQFGTEVLGDLGHMPSEFTRVYKPKKKSRATISADSFVNSDSFVNPGSKLETEPSHVEGLAEFQASMDVESQLERKETHGGLISAGEILPTTTRPGGLPGVSRIARSRDASFDVDVRCLGAGSNPGDYLGDQSAELEPQAMRQVEAIALASPLVARMNVQDKEKLVQSMQRVLSRKVSSAFPKILESAAMKQLEFLDSNGVQIWRKVTSQSIQPWMTDRGDRLLTVLQGYVLMSQLWDLAVTAKPAGLGMTPDALNVETGVTLLKRMSQVHPTPANSVSKGEPAIDPGAGPFVRVNNLIFPLEALSELYLSDFLRPPLAAGAATGVGPDGLPVQPSAEEMSRFEQEQIQSGPAVFMMRLSRRSGGTDHKLSLENQEALNGILVALSSTQASPVPDTMLKRLHRVAGFEVLSVPMYLAQKILDLDSEFKPELTAPLAVMKSVAERVMTGNIMKSSDVVLRTIFRATQMPDSEWRQAFASNPLASVRYLGVPVLVRRLVELTQALDYELNRIMKEDLSPERQASENSAAHIQKRVAYAVKLVTNSVLHFEILEPLLRMFTDLPIIDLIRTSFSHLLVKVSRFPGVNVETIVPEGFRDSDKSKTAGDKHMHGPASRSSAQNQNQRHDHDEVPARGQTGQIVNSGRGVRVNFDVQVAPPAMPGLIRRKSSKENGRVSDASKELRIKAARQSFYSRLTGDAVTDVSSIKRGSQTSMGLNAIDSGDIQPEALESTLYSSSTVSGSSGSIDHFPGVPKESVVLNMNPYGLGLTDDILTTEGSHIVPFPLNQLSQSVHKIESVLDKIISSSGILEPWMIGKPYAIYSLLQTAIYVQDLMHTPDLSEMGTGEGVSLHDFRETVFVERLKQEPVFLVGGFLIPQSAVQSLLLGWAPDAEALHIYSVNVDATPDEQKAAALLGLSSEGVRIHTYVVSQMDMKNGFYQRLPQLTPQERRLVYPFSNLLVALWGSDTQTLLSAVAGLEAVLPAGLTGFARWMLPFNQHPEEFCRLVQPGKLATGLSAWIDTSLKQVNDLMAAPSDHSVGKSASSHQGEESQPMSSSKSMSSSKPSSLSGSLAVEEVIDRAYIVVRAVKALRGLFAKTIEPEWVQYFEAKMRSLETNAKTADEQVPIDFI